MTGARSVSGDRTRLNGTPTRTLLQTWRMYCDLPAYDLRGEPTREEGQRTIRLQTIQRQRHQTVGVPQLHLTTLPKPPAATLTWVPHKSSSLALHPA